MRDDSETGLEVPMVPTWVKHEQDSELWARMSNMREVVGMTDADFLIYQENFIALQAAHERNFKRGALLTAQLAAFTLAGIHIEIAARNGYKPSWLIDLLVPSEIAGDIHANLEEVFPLWVHRHGVRRATWTLRFHIPYLIVETWSEKLAMLAERIGKVIKLGS